jgi:hypothetical protein
MSDLTPTILEKVNHIIYSNLDHIKIPPKLKNDSVRELKHQILDVFENIENTVSIYLTQYAELYKKQAAQTETLMNHMFECMALLELVLDRQEAEKIAHSNPSSGGMEKFDQYLNEKKGHQPTLDQKSLVKNG